MPLIKSKSKKAFKHNVEAEIHAGKPQKKAVAIAYNVKRAAKKAIGGRASTNPMDYDSDWDYYRAMGQMDDGDDDSNEEDTAPRMNKVQKFKNQKFVNKVTGNRKLADVATAKGNKPEADKQWAKLKKRVESNRLKSWAESELKAGPSKKAEGLRKEWSEKIGAGKPAPFKSGGKVKHPNW